MRVCLVHLLLTCCTQSCSGVAHKAAAQVRRCLVDQRWAPAAQHLLHKHTVLPALLCFAVTLSRSYERAMSCFDSTVLTPCCYQPQPGFSCLC